MVTVNSVVYVRDFLGLSSGAVPVALGAYGAGSMAVALVVPRLLERVGERAVMVRGALALGGVFASVGVITAAHSGSWRVPALLAAWAAFGGACSMVLTPTGRLVRRAAPERERTAAFAAQFSLSHACWLLTYPLAGWLGARAGLGAAVVGLAVVAVGAGVAAARLWPVGVDGSVPEVEHEHVGLAADHPHVHDAVRVSGGWRHSHRRFGDALHATR